MAKRRSSFRLFALGLMSSFFCIGLASCGDIGNAVPSEVLSSIPTDKDEVQLKIRALYDQAVAEGKTSLSYDEWLDSIRGEKGEDGHSPVLTIDAEGYWCIDGISTGVKASGRDGTPGNDGTSVRHGNGAPSSSLGNPGDSYIDLSTWDFYIKDASGWHLSGNIKGDRGQDGNQKGDDGTSIHTGAGAPDANLGNEDDSYIDLSTWDFYVKGEDGWRIVGNIKGEQGQSIKGDDGNPGNPGKDGSSLRTGSGAPVSGVGDPGDSYIDVATWDFYVKDETRGWVKQGNIKGEGEKGAKGDDGTSMRTGNGAPSAELGNPGDSYIDLSTWDFYVKTSSGWVKSGNIKGEGGSTGEATPTYHSVTFHPEGGTLPLDYPNPQTVKHGDAIELLPEPTRKYYDFSGWYTGIGPNHGQLTDLTPITRDIDVYAIYEQTRVTLTIDLDNGSQPIVLQRNAGLIPVADIDYAKLLAQKEGYAFSYWEMGGEAIGDYIDLYEDATVIAKYRAASSGETKTYVVTVKLNNGEADLVMSYEEGYMLQQLDRDPTYEGYRFKGYKNQSTGAMVTFPLKVESNIVLEAVWERVETPSTHTITLKLNNGEADRVYTYAEGAIVYSFDVLPSKEGYDFVGYVYGEDQETFAMPYTMGNHDIVVEAVYKLIEVVPTDRTLEIYASNDFHGAVDEVQGVDSEGKAYYEVGLAKFGTFFKAKDEQPNTLLLDQGDTWQGSLRSNYNYGNLVTDVMTYAGFDARTVGNHDFDWGADKIAANVTRAVDGYSIPNLAANIYDYDFSSHTFGDNQQSQLGGTSVTYTLENGLKVGIVGVIGESQITSIESTIVEHYGFKSHVSILQDEALKLRREGCDVIIASIHGGEEDLKGRGMEDYVDLVLCGHTHRAQTSVENGLHYGQFYKNGRQFGFVSMTVSGADNKVDQDKTTVTPLNAAYISNNVAAIDTRIQSMIDASNAVCDSVGATVLHNNVSGVFGQRAEAPNLMAAAMYEQAVAEGYDDIDFAYVNYARSDLPSGSITYGDLYGAFPFDNKVHIVEIDGYELVKEIKGFNYSYIANPGSTFHYGQKYKVAVLDYLLNHTNDNRYYDYFSYAISHKLGVLSKNYREILADYLVAHASETLSPSDYDSDLPRYARKELDIKCNVSFMLNDGGDAVYESMDMDYGAFVSNNLPAEPTRDGYAFGGWYLDAACSRALSASNQLTSDITLYAKWTEASSGGDTNNNLTATVNLNTFASQGLSENYSEAKANSFTLEAAGGNGTTASFVLAYEGLYKEERYNEFCIASGGFIQIQVPRGYRIASLFVDLYRNENLNFYDGLGNILEEARDESQTNHIKYTIDGNGNEIIKMVAEAANGNYTAKIYSFTVTFAPIA